MAEAREAVLRQNFDYFQSVVSGHMALHAGEYALLRFKSVVGFFEKPLEAVQAGRSQFDDDLFSVQRVIDRPLDLGFIAYGAGERVTD